MPLHTREHALEVADELNWTLARINKKGYVLLKCPCGVHFKWLHKTPSNPDHFKDAIGYLRRQKCGQTSGEPE